MKKVIIVAIAIIILGGGGYLVVSHRSAVESPAGQMIKQATKEGLEVKPNSLLGWLTGKKGVECIVNSPDGEMKVTAKEGKVRIDGIAFHFGADAQHTSEKGTTLTVGDWMYMWSGQDGTKMNLKKIREMSVNENKEKQETEVKSWKDTVKEWEAAGYTYHCRAVNPPDSFFQPPADVNFVDFTAQLEQWQNMANQFKNIQQQATEGDQIDTSKVQQQMKEIQEMMDKMK